LLHCNKSLAAKSRWPAHPRFGRRAARLRRQEDAKKAEAWRSWRPAASDLVGQRVTKIAETLDRVIATRMKAEKRPEARCAAIAQGQARTEGPGFPGASDEDQARSSVLRQL